MLISSYTRTWLFHTVSTPLHALMTIVTTVLYQLANVPDLKMIELNKRHAVIVIDYCSVCDQLSWPFRSAKMSPTPYLDNTEPLNTHLYNTHFKSYHFVPSEWYKLCYDLNWCSTCPHLTFICNLYSSQLPWWLYWQCQHESAAVFTLTHTL